MRRPPGNDVDENATRHCRRIVCLSAGRGGDRHRAGMRSRAWQRLPLLCNCIPVFIAKTPAWWPGFGELGYRLIGLCEAKSAPTSVHRVLANWFRERGVQSTVPTSSNFGGTVIPKCSTRERLNRKRSKPAH